MNLINKIFIIILSFSIFGCSLFDEDITSPNTPKSAQEINAELNGYKIKIFGETFTFSGDILSKSIEVKGDGEKYTTVSSTKYNSTNKIRYFFNNQGLNLDGMTVDDNGAATDNNNAILIKFKITPKKDYSFYPEKETVLHPTLRSLAGEEITVKLIPNKTWGKSIGFDDIQEALRNIKYNDETGKSKLEFDKIDIKNQKYPEELWVTNIGTEFATNEMKKALEETLNKKPIPLTKENDKLTVEQYYSHLSYHSDMYGGLFIKYITILPKNDYGIDIDKLENIPLTTGPTIAWDDIIGNYNPSDIDIVFHVYILPSKNQIID